MKQKQFQLADLVKQQLDILELEERKSLERKVQ